MSPRPTTPAIERLVAHNGGPVALSKSLGGRPVYQEIQRWLKRGWASSVHFLELKRLAPPGVEIEDLYRDRTQAEARKSRAEAKAAKTKKAA